jgi:hypothetical protein
MEIVRIAQLADDSTSMIEGRQFENVEIRGPAILVPLDNNVFADCTFDGTFESVFRAVPDGTVLVGVIGLRAVAFRGCRFRNVGIWGPEELIQQAGQAFLRGPES